MKERLIGRVRRVNGPVIEAEFITDAMMTELVRVSDARLIGEIIKLSGDRAIIQVYEDTTGVAPGNNIYGAGMPLSVELGPGIIGAIYDGIQRPLEQIAAVSGSYIQRGIQAPSLDRERQWEFTPVKQVGDQVHPGEILGTVQETGRIEHRIPAPLLYAAGGSEGTHSAGSHWDSGIIEEIVPAGSYTVEQCIARIRVAGSSRDSDLLEATMIQRWPIRKPRPVKDRLALQMPLITGQRVIDTLFPLAKGGDGGYPRRLRDRQDHDTARHRQVVRCRYHRLHRLR